jgi:hypothetical protein
MLRPRIVAGLAVAALLAGSFLAAHPVQAQVEPLAQQRADLFFASVRTHRLSPREIKGTVSYASAEIVDGVLVIRDVEIIRGLDDHTTIEEVRVTRFDWAKPHNPEFGDARYVRMRFPRMMRDAEVRRRLEESGLDEIVMNTRVAFRYENGPATLHLDDATLQIERYGTFAFSASLTDISPEMMQFFQLGFNFYMTPMFLSATSLQRLRLSIKDEGGIALELRGKALRDKVPEAAAMDLLLVPIQSLKSVPYGAVRDTAAAFENFLRSRGAITLEANPSTPVKLRRFVDLLDDSSPLTIARLLLDLRISVSAH